MNKLVCVMCGVWCVMCNFARCDVQLWEVLFVVFIIFDECTGLIAIKPGHHNVNEDDIGT